jgi:uncharacterized membrane protein YbaN (DUF454 family)
MRIIKIIIEILCVALVTMLLYAWGYVKQQRQSNDLLGQLNRKAQKKIIKGLKKNGSMTRKEMESQILNLKASLFYSKNKVEIKQPKMMTKSIIENLMNKGIIEIDNSEAPKKYVLK